MMRPMWAGLIGAMATLPLGAAAAERLAPLSKTAQSITGPIVLAPDHVTMAGHTTLKLAPAGTAVPFDGGFGTGPVAADLYRILTPADPTLIRGNRLCGTGQPLTFLLVWHETGISGQVTTLAVSTSPTPPATLDGTCGTFSYVPGR